MLRRLAIGLLSISLSFASAAACEFSEGWLVMEPTSPTDVRVGAKLPTQPLSVTTQFDVDILVCDSEPSEVIFDATMPAHKHGMNYVPVTEALENGRYKGVGMFFHMPGAWEISVDLKSETTQRFTIEVRAQ